METVPTIQFQRDWRAAEQACDVVMLLARRKVAFHFQLGPEDHDDTEQWVHFGCLALNSGNDLQEQA